MPVLHINRMSDHRYVGCAVESMQARARSHRTGLGSGKQSNMLTRKQVADYSVDAFFFFVLQAHRHSEESSSQYQLEQHELWRPIHDSARRTLWLQREGGHIRTPAARFWAACERSVDFGKMKSPAIHLIRSR